MKISTNFINTLTVSITLMMGISFSLKTINYLESIDKESYHPVFNNTEIKHPPRKAFDIDQISKIFPAPIPKIKTSAKTLLRDIQIAGKIISLDPMHSKVILNARGKVKNLGVGGKINARLTIKDIQSETMTVTDGKTDFIVSLSSNKLIPTSDRLTF